MIFAPPKTTSKNHDEKATKKKKAVKKFKAFNERKEKKAKNNTYSSTFCRKLFLELYEASGAIEKKTFKKYFYIMTQT